MHRSKFAVAAAFSLATVLLSPVPPAQAATAAVPYDFDGNGHPDLTAGAPDLQVGSVKGAGGVVVLPATKAGVGTRPKFISQSSSGVPGASEPGDAFGAALASADFDRDGYADLAVGLPDETSADASRAGRVTLVYGSRTGLNTQRSANLTNPTGDQAYSSFGYALVAADLTGDGYPDLAVGAPQAELRNEGTADFPPSGSVTILRGSASGLETTASITLRGQEVPTQDYDFGSSLAVGDLNADGRTDLVVGSTGLPYGDDDGYRGSVSSCLGGVDGPTGCRQLAYDRLLSGLNDLAVGNVSGGDRPEIVAGVAYRDDDDSGAVQILSLTGGTDPGLDTVTGFTQNSPGIPGSDEDFDAFGAAVELADLDDDGYDDLVIGSPGEDLAGGYVTVVYGAETGWRPTGNRTLGQATTGVPRAKGSGHYFGGSISLLDYDADGRPDLTVGAFGDAADSGSVTVLRGAGGYFTTSGAQATTLAGLKYSKPASGSYGATLGG